MWKSHRIRLAITRVYWSCLQLSHLMIELGNAMATTRVQTWASFTTRTTQTLSSRTWITSGTWTKARRDCTLAFARTPGFVAVIKSSRNPESFTNSIVSHNYSCRRGWAKLRSNPRREKLEPCKNGFDIQLTHITNSWGSSTVLAMWMITVPLVSVNGWVTKVLWARPARWITRFIRRR